jgi:2-polyprenyl-3-methyl-5-hydroxy-6-metoxy-1,4-benzoquinol methylase
MEKTVRHVTCPLCRKSNLRLHLSTTDYSISKEPFDLFRCGDCDFIFTQNAPDEAHIGKYYESDDYISHSDTKRGVVNRLYHVARDFMLSQKWNLLRRLSDGKKLLDLGSGSGYFLNFMKSKGYAVAGVEVSDSAVTFSKERFGLDVRSPLEFLTNYGEKNFDIVTMWHVLEHLHDSDAYLQQVHKILKTNGLLVIAVPNCSSYDATHYQKFWAGYDVPRHLWHFTPKTLRTIADRNGFKVETIKKLPLDPFYNAMLSEKYKKNPLFLPAGFLFGMLAYLTSVFNIERASSPIYILKKT